MFWTVVIAAQFLKMETYQVYYLIVMGYIEAVKISNAWRIVPEGVIEYDKQHLNRKNRKAGGNSICRGGFALLFSLPDNGVPHDLPERTGCVQGRRRRMVHNPERRSKILYPSIKPLNQLEFLF